MLSRSQYESGIGTYLVSYNIQRQNKKNRDKKCFKLKKPKRSNIRDVQMVVDIFIDIDNIYYFVRKVMKK